MPIRDEPRTAVPQGPHTEGGRRREGERLGAPAMAWSSSTSQMELRTVFATHPSPPAEGVRQWERNATWASFPAPSALPQTGLGTWEDPLETGSSQEVLSQEGQLGDQDSPPHREKLRAEREESPLPSPCRGRLGEGILCSETSRAPIQLTWRTGGGGGGVPGGTRERKNSVIFFLAPG